MSEMPQDRELDERIDEAEEESDLISEAPGVDDDDVIDPEAPLDDTVGIDETDDEFREWSEAHPDTD
jgi:hypothetical protein